MSQVRFLSPPPVFLINVIKYNGLLGRIKFKPTSLPTNEIQLSPYIHVLIKLGMNATEQGTMHLLSAKHQHQFYNHADAIDFAVNKYSAKILC